MNLANPETVAYIAIAAMTLAVIAMIVTISHYLANKKLLRGATQDVGTSIEQVVKDMKSLDVFRRDLEEYLRSVETRLKTSFRGMHTIRFNPFQGDGSGGFQSFATAFVNEDGTGVIISSLHARDRMSVFAKPVSKFASELTLTEEEQEALSKAKESCKL
jgi:hypothetical protein